MSRAAAFHQAELLKLARALARAHAEADEAALAGGGFPRHHGGRFHSTEESTGDHLATR